MKKRKLKTEPATISWPALRIIPLILIFCSLTSCVLPDFHTTWRSQEVGGQVLDESIHAPIEGAKIFFTYHTNLWCRSDTNGCYLIKETHNWHCLIFIGAGNSEDWPPREVWDPYITISHTNYITREVDWGYGHPKVILLKKIGEASKPHPWLTFNGDGVILQDRGAAQYLKPGDIHFEHRNYEGDHRPFKLHIGFVQPVYDVQVRLVNDVEKTQISIYRGGELDWECTFLQLHSSNLKDSDRVYRLEFTP